MKRSAFKHGFVYLLIVITIVVIVSTILRPSSQGGQPPQPDEASDTNPWDHGFGWVLCGPPILGVAGIMLRTYLQQRKLMERIDRSRFQEMPDQQGEIPAISQPIVDALLERGFTRIGDLAYVTADDKPISGLPTFLEANNRAIAVVAALSHLPKPNLAIETLYTSGAVLHTYYPYGVSARSAISEASRRRKGPGEAIDYHLRRMQEFGVKHGPIYAAADVKDRVAWMTAFGKRPASAFAVWYSQVGWLMPVLGLLIIAGLAVNTRLFGDTLRAYFLYGSCLIAVGLAVYNVIRGRVMLKWW